MKVVHLAEGTHWAGIESHLYHLLPDLNSENVIILQCIFLADGLLSNRVRSKKINVQIVSPHFKFDPLAFNRIRRILVKSDVNVIHMHGYRAIFYGLVASIGLNIKRVITIHQPAVAKKDIGDFKFKCYLMLAYGLARKLHSKYIAVSDDVKKRWELVWKIPSQDIYTIYNGINFDQVLSMCQRDVKRKLNYYPKGKVISVIGRLDPVKGHSYFLQAAKEVLIAFPQVRFLVIGDGPLKNELQNFCGEVSSLSHQVTFLGFRKDVIDWLVLTDIMVISSLYEGIPYTLLEAMVLGKAIVSTEVGGIKEVITNNMNGLLVTPESSLALARAICSLLNDEKEMTRLGMNAKRSANERFSSAEMTKKVISLYKKI